MDRLCVRPGRYPHLPSVVAEAGVAATESSTSSSMASDGDMSKNGTASLSKETVPLRCVQDEPELDAMDARGLRNRIEETKQQWGRWYLSEMHPRHIVARRTVFDSIQFSSLRNGQDQVFLWDFP
jgi:hypothetical protein